MSLLMFGSSGCTMEEGRSAFKMLTGKITGKRPLGRPRHKWEGSIRMDLKKEIGINMRIHVRLKRCLQY